jgi:S-adenosylmethionine:tRNA ribosyltransferase-isomerase
MDLTTTAFDYHLPQELIAQSPAPEREGSRLLVLHRAAGTIEHRRFTDIVAYIRPDDILIANRSRVIPARLRGQRESGGQVELLLLRELAPGRWQALARPGRRLRPGMRITFPRSTVRACVESRGADGEWTVRFDGAPDIRSAIRSLGSMPLPPYITNQDASPDRYQTVYADREGSVAAPTAGLHFSTDLLRRIAERGTRVEFVTLHVGPGTFRPVTTEFVRDHQMHAEWGEVPPSVAEAANEVRARGGRLVAVGTTTVRLLESAAMDGKLGPFGGETSRFIVPGYRFQVIDALLTNFHLPRSTLLMLVSAFAGRDLILDAYREAIECGYRFFSFGDAMLIL